MSWVATAVVGSAVIGGVSSYLAADNAAGQQADAANNANATQLAMFNQQREDNAPWRAAGMSALNGMGSGDFKQDFQQSDYQADPGYAFRMQEGLKALNSSASAKGNMNSGATMKALMKYGQNMGSQEYGAAYDRFNADRDRRFNRLASLAGVGQTAQTQTNAAGQNYANQVSANQIGVGNANAAATVAGSNAFNQTLQTGMNGWMQNQYMNQMNSKIPQQQVQQAPMTYSGGQRNYISGEGF
jgi:hypothetical protein